MSDAELWLKLKKGDAQVLGYVYNKYVKDLYRFGRQFSADQSLVQDCIQDVFIALGKKQESDLQVKVIKAYLFKSVYREIVYKLRKGKNINLMDDLEALGAFKIDISMESVLMNQENYTEKLQKVKAALNTLTPKQRQTILHYYYDGLTYDEIAGVMGIEHKNTVAKLMKRAIDLMKQNIVLFLTVLLGRAITSHS